MESLHSYSAQRSIRGVDPLLDRYQQEKKIIVDLLNHNPDLLTEKIWKKEGYFSIDNGCGCKMGRGERRSMFACSHCNSIRKLTETSTTLGNPFLIHYGERIGSMMIIESFNISNPFLYFDSLLEKRARQFMESNRDIRVCGSEDAVSKMEGNYRCLVGDKLTVSTLVRWQLEKIMKDSSMESHVHDHFTSFICSKMGYQFLQHPSVGSYLDLKKESKFFNKRGNLLPSVARGIILQLTAFLREAGRHSFSHGSPIVNSLYFDEGAVAYKYDGIVVKSPLILKVGNLGNSSMLINDCHISRKNLKAEIFFEKEIFIPEIIIEENSLKTDRCVNGCTNNHYRLNDEAFNVYQYIRHVGIPLFIGSFDIYCFFISLMTDIPFYNTAVTDYLLYNLWNSLWDEEELPIIDSRIRELHSIGEERFSLSSSFYVLKGMKLKCDGLEAMWELMKRLISS